MMNAQSMATTDSLTRKETREIITPFAFEVAPELFGTPLASPIRRGISLLIDLCLVAMLTNVSSVFWAGVVAVMFFRAGNRLKQKKRLNSLRIFLRFLTAILLFVFAFGIFDEFIQEDKDEGIPISVNGDDLSSSSAFEVIALTAKHVAAVSRVSSDIENGNCTVAMDCWTSAANALVDDLAGSAVIKKDATDLFSLITGVAQEDLSDQEINKLEAVMLARYEQFAPEQIDTDQTMGPPENQPDNTDHTDDTKPYSILSWILGIADDLGIGFGWAAVYFTASTTWFNGRTLGKKLLGIQVIKLDNTRINLWESFERYGGYGAGLATGLLGFLQILWDPNRQAIQDKISETLVINTRKTKINLELSINGEPSSSPS